MLPGMRPCESRRSPEPGSWRGVGRPDIQPQAVLVALVVVLPAGLICGQIGEAVTAFRVAGAHGAAGCGGLQRKLPSGGAANGMPRNVQEDSFAMPWTSPLTVVTRHETVCGVASNIEVANAINAAEIKALVARSCLRMGVLTSTWRKGVASGVSSTWTLAFAGGARAAQRWPGLRGRATPVRPLCRSGQRVMPRP